MSVLESLINVLPYLPELFDDEISFGITDRERYLKLQFSEDINLNITEGEAIPKQDSVLEAMKTGKTMVKLVPKEIYGITIRSYSIPVRDEAGKVVGCIAAAKSLSRRRELRTLSKTLSTALKQISSAINELSSGVQDVADMNSEVLSKAKAANENAKNTNEILSFIQGVSSQTNLLGLNAAIESARAGEYGRGFNVVAKEIRKLSTTTSESIKKIDDVLKNTELSIGSITEKISESNTIFQDQAATLEEIAASIQELNSSAEMLEDLAEKI